MVSLNHIGIAIVDLPKMQKLFSVLGLTVTHQETVLEQGVKTYFLPLPLVQGSIELLEPIQPNGTIAQFIKKKGPGIHHLSFLVDEGKLEFYCGRLKEEGFATIYEHPKLGAHGMKINFIHPSSCGGILIELMESTSSLE